MLIQYFIVTYSKISPSKLIGLEQNTKSTQYNPYNPIVTVFNQVEEFIEYGELDRSPYTNIQAINTTYTIINRTRNDEPNSIKLDQF